MAYVTLKVGRARPANGIENQMNILDISDVTQPILIETVAMQGPEGLSVSGDSLYVCGDIAG